MNDVLKQVNLYTIIDIKGLINFYKDSNNLYWGSFKNPCKADSFFKIKAPDCSFYNLNERIPFLEMETEYNLMISALYDKSGFSTQNNKIYMEMVHVLKGKNEPEKGDWENIFNLVENYSIENGMLLIENSSKGNGCLFKIKTKKQNHKKTKTTNLSYAFKFTFFDDENQKRHGIIDPFIIVRSDDLP